MSRSTKGVVRLAALSAVLAIPTFVLASGPNLGSTSNGSFTIAPPLPNASAEMVNQKAADKNGETGDLKQALYLADSADAPNIHGFFSLPFKTAYVTPRGLVVENQGLVVQPVAGMVFPIADIGPLKDFTFVAGVWNSFNEHQDDERVGSWNECDFFASFSWKMGDQLNFALTYGAWFFPESTPNKPDVEQNLDLKISFDDSKMWGSSGFALNPYVDLWYAIAGSSTVVLGDTGSTGYVELGIVPTYTCKAIANYPLTFTFPTYVSVGPNEYWDATGAFDDSNFGLFSVSANVSVPLSMIPVKYGHWHLDAGVTYDYIINDALLEAGHILSGNDDRNVFIGSVGIGVNF